MGRGGRFEPATTLTGPCGGETGPDLDPPGAVAETPFKTRRHSDDRLSAGSAGLRTEASRGLNTPTGKGFPRQIKTGGWAGRVTGPLGVS